MAKSSDKSFLQALGDNVRKHRLKNDMSQSQLAYEISTTLRQIQRIEAGTANASVLYYYKIAQVLEIDFITLMKVKA